VEVTEKNMDRNGWEDGQSKAVQDRGERVKGGLKYSLWKRVDGCYSYTSGTR
jgi:hypothetical protein